MNDTCGMSWLARIGSLIYTLTRFIPMKQADP